MDEAKFANDFEENFISNLNKSKLLNYTEKDLELFGFKKKFLSNELCASTLHKIGSL